MNQIANWHALAKLLNYKKLTFNTDDSREKGRTYLSYSLYKLNLL